MSRCAARAERPETAARAPVGDTIRLRPDAMPSVTHIRVRYKDTDTMSVVYYGNYLTYF